MVASEGTERAGVGIPRRLLGLVTSVAWVAGSLIVGWLLWPSSLGGCTTLTIVSGESMEPTYYTGDLVVSRCGPVEVGDVIVYNPPDVGGARLIHRIVDGDASGWIVQGDNNDFLDPWQPTEENILGSAVLHLPQVGKFAAILLSPLTWLSLLILALALVVWPGRKPEETVEPHETQPQDPEPAEPDETQPQDPEPAEPELPRGMDSGSAHLIPRTTSSHRSTEMARLRAARPTNPMRRRLAAMVLVVVGIAGLGVASAAQLNVSNGSLAAGTAVVASCQTSGPISVGFTTSFSTGAYRATAITLSGIDSACDGLNYKIQVLGTSGSLVELVSPPTIPSGGSLTRTFAAIAVTSIISVAVVISS